LRIEGIDSLLCADRGSRGDEMGRTRRHRAGELAQRAQIVDDPERASLGGEDEIVIARLEVGDGGDREALRESLPPAASVERDIESVLRAGVEHRRHLGVLGE